MKSSLHMLEIGQFKDLEHLIALLNQTFPRMSYRLESIPTQEGAYLFIEDPMDEDEYECGVVMKMGQKAYAYSDAVHAMILGAYQDYLEKTT